VNYSKVTHDKLSKEITAYATQAGFSKITCIPASGLKGDMVVSRGDRMPWYTGVTLKEAIDAFLPDAKAEEATHIPIELMVRKNDARFYGGTVEGEVLCVGDNVHILPSLRKAKIQQLFVGGKEESRARAGAAVMFSFDRDVDCMRGASVVKVKEQFAIADVLRAQIFVATKDIRVGQRYLLERAHHTVPCTITKVVSMVTLSDGVALPHEVLHAGDIGGIELHTHEAVVRGSADSLSSIMLIDPMSHETVAVGSLTLLHSHEHSLRSLVYGAFWFRENNAREGFAKRAGSTRHFSFSY
jgi:sulfate adenylyltransferase subunit 1 (EFTu-like GTPase family)